MGIQVQRDTYIGVSHDILQALWVHVPVCKSCAECMTQDMRCYLWQAVLMVLVVLLCQIGKGYCIIGVCHWITFPVQKEETAVTVNRYRLCFLPLCHDTFQCLFYFLTHGNITHTALCLWRFYVVANLFAVK